MCKHCQRYFYITTKTAFPFHKLPLVDLLAAITLFVNSMKGISAITLSQHLNIQYKTYDLSPLQGESKTGYLKFHPTKRSIISLVQRVANNEDSNRTIVAIDYSESANTILSINRQFVKKGSDIFYDENPAYSSLDFHYNRWSVNHQEAYSAKGVNNNLAESFNARFRDLHRGVHHKCDNKYALHYANQVSYMSDNLCKSNEELFQNVLKRCLWVLPLREWVGY